MYDELQKKLEKFLIEYNISNETNIFNQILMKLAGISVAKNTDYGFTKYSNKEEGLYFSVPDIGFDEIFKLLDFFNIPRDHYKHRASLKISKSMLFDTLLPMFEAHIRELHGNAAFELKSYVIKSKPLLEAKAVKKITTATSTSLYHLYKDYPATKREGQEPLVRSLEHLSNIIEQLNTNSNLYTEVTASQEELSQYTPNESLLPHMQDLMEGLRNYAKFNRAESVLAVENFFKEVHAFMEHYHIHSADCDIFEETLLTLARITNAPKSCSIKSGKDLYRDPTRVIFIFEGMNAEDAKKFLQYLNDMGDETAKETNEDNDRRMYLESFQVDSMPKRTREKRLEKHCFEVDGLALYQIIFPQFQQFINECAEKSPLQLKKYQEISAYKAIIESLVKLERAIERRIPEEGVDGTPLEWMSTLLAKLSTLRTNLDVTSNQINLLKQLQEAQSIVKEYSSNSLVQNVVVVDLLNEVAQKLAAYQLRMKGPEGTGVPRVGDASIATNEGGFFSPHPPQEVGDFKSNNTPLI